MKKYIIKLKLIFFVLIIFFIFFVVNYIYSQNERFTVFKTQNRGFKFYTENNTILILNDVDRRLIKVTGFVYTPEVNSRAGYLTPRCPCDLDNSIRDCPVPYISNFRLGNFCYDNYIRTYTDQYSVKYNLNQVSETDNFQFYIGEGVVKIKGDLDVEYNKNNECYWEPSSGFYDFDTVSEEGQTICSDGYFMKGIRFRGSTRDVNSLDMWRILCCKL
ncbi:MAG: hypothetical protein KatS3mg095_0111 [Candidatus Parcubacteria bacterium]|nr:MAG: hypothetical protein KatS3mg095_0111 [Candidatus Parcubacteria bacterium]